MTQADIDVTTLSDWIREYARVIGENAGYLTDLDACSPRIVLHESHSMNRTNHESL